MGLDHADGGVMADRLAAGQRAAPDGWHAGLAMPLSAHTERALDQRAAGSLAEPVVIDWTATRVSPRSGVAAAGKAANWQDRFVNHLGATPERMNPNAALRLHLAAENEVTPKLQLQ
jgi:hypothetical protein